MSDRDVWKDSKVEPTLRYFAELRASLKNSLDVTSEISLQMAALVTENAELRGRLKMACEPCAECGHIDWRELDDILQARGLGRE